MEQSAFGILPSVLAGIGLLVGMAGTYLVMNSRLKRRIQQEIESARGQWQREAERESLRRQDEKLEAIGRLAGGIAHDLNNYLTAILGYSELALEMAADGDPHRQEIEPIKRSAEQAFAFTKELLAFSRTQAMRMEMLSLDTLIGDMETMLREMLRPVVQLRMALDSRPFKVHVDRQQMERVINDLVLNSQASMPNGGSISISTLIAELEETSIPGLAGIMPGSYVLIAIHDNAEALDESARTRLFEPFFTTKRLGRGRGLGLAVVHGIIKQSGGHILFQSEKGNGNTIKIYLPKV